LYAAPPVGCVLQGCLLEGSAAPCVVINGKSLTFSFALDALEVVAQLSQDFLPPLPNDKVRMCHGVVQSALAWCSRGHRRLGSR
jgi:hypothetical protein